MKAPVYINWSRFIAECPHEGCGDAREVHPGEKRVTCAAGHSMDLVWPDGIERVMTVLGERTADKRRNWFPAGHPVAVRLSQPHGQSIDDLRAEAEEGEAADAALIADRRAHLLLELRRIGVTTEEALNVLKGS
jgi:hypothetical protein